MADNIQFESKRLICCDCGEGFQFTAGEAQYFWSKGLSQPKRCPECRQKRRQTLVRDQGVAGG